MIRSWRKVIGTLLGVVATVSSCACGGVQSTLNAAGPQSHSINKIWWLTFSVSSAVFVIVTTILLVGVFKRPRDLANTSTGPELNPNEQTERTKQKVVIGATAMTITILFVFLLASFFIGRGLTAELSQKKGVVIEVTGHQWWWEVRYLNVDASSIFTTANEIHIPVGVPVAIMLKASDVVHSFWVPNLQGKKDLIPGKISSLWLQADKEGVYRGQCAEYCGLQHAHMALWIIAEPPGQFNSWIRSQTQPAAAPRTESETRGQQIFLGSSCVMCHTISGTPAGSNIGPNLTHLASRKTIAAATLENDREHITNWVNNSQRIKPGNRMPPMNFADKDLQPLVDYLLSLK